VHKYSISNIRHDYHVPAQESKSKTFKLKG